MYHHPSASISSFSLHDALPIFHGWQGDPGAEHFLDDLQRLLHTLKGGARLAGLTEMGNLGHNFETLLIQDRKSTRLNSSHVAISYAVFCLKKKKNTLHNN